MNATPEQLKMIVESAFAARFLIGDDHILYVNRATEDMFGYSAEELVGGTVDILLPEEVRARHPALRADYYKAPRRILLGVDKDLRARKKSGAEFPIHLGLAPIRDEDGRLFVAVTVFDISHHKEVERQLVERANELQLANERLGRFAYIASHDLQEPLRKIAAFADIVAASIAKGDLAEAAHASEVARASALRARELVDGLLAFSRQVSTPPRLEPLDIRREIESVVSDFSELIRQTQARVVVSVPPGVLVEADKPQFERCLSSLLSNAIKYRKPGRTPNIRFFMRGEPELALSVADDGIGFEPKYAEAIFEPLRRLHSFAQYPGTGVGLALCKSMCERHGWRIEATSQLGAGATFTMTIPQGEAAPKVSPLKASA
ncbi:PAS domain S-box protein [Methylosinus sporium]|uniref:histidine kinase n=1 Tax=Methylosinus sporium TaxID=428 RepID=A0A549T2X1_METSR|nr:MULTISPECIES: ATP-binding protein [Methylosinus]MBU3889482.1 PAS domain S-box protein [Methylosinus sp. KRF6]TRL36211.1 PAS domain S-box protein [Methylosinus sporium]